MSNVESPINSLLKHCKTDREAAVLIALELIKTDLSNSNASSKLSEHLDLLPKYTDKIEVALKSSLKS